MLQVQSLNTLSFDSYVDNRGDIEVNSNTGSDDEEKRQCILREEKIVFFKEEINKIFSDIPQSKLTKIFEKGCFK